MGCTVSKLSPAQTIKNKFVAKELENSETGLPFKLQSFQDFEILLIENGENGHRDRAEPASKTRATTIQMMKKDTRQTTSQKLATHTQKKGINVKRKGEWPIATSVWRSTETRAGDAAVAAWSHLTRPQW